MNKATVRNMTTSELMDIRHDLDKESLIILCEKLSSCEEAVEIPHCEECESLGEEIEDLRLTIDDALLSLREAAKSEDWDAVEDAMSELE